MTMKKIFKVFYFLLIFFSVTINVNANQINIIVDGNERISKETIIIFSKVNNDEKINVNSLNKILKNLYETNFFSDVSVKFEKNTLFISVRENPIIQNIIYEGVKSSKILDEITKNLNLRARSSYNEILLKNDKEIIFSTLKNLGYFFPTIETYLELLDNNKIDLKYVIDIGEKSKIKKISFIGDKVYKNSKLRNIIVSEEYKFWKFLSGKKYLNENLSKLDMRLLKNFYLNNGYYNVEINQSYAKLLSDDEFELIFNINANQKIYFKNISLDLPNDFEIQNYSEITDLFEKIKGKHYSLNLIEKILNKIELITINEQNLSVKASVSENLIEDQIDLIFKVEESQKFIVEKINIFGNNITQESVIRNQLEIDEGDFFNEILKNKSLNNIKNLNFFKYVKAEVIDGNETDSKIINITVSEKPTGEISAGAGVGTSGGTITFGIKENNYLGRGVGLSSNVTIEEDSIKGSLTLSNPNFKNSNKSVYGSIQADENDQLSTFGYKSSKTGFILGTRFEYLEDLTLGLGSSSFYEEIVTSSAASALQKKQAGDYWDTFLKVDFDYDKRNQKFRPSEGFRSIYKIDLPLISETDTLTNSYEYRFYDQFLDNNTYQLSFFIKSASSLSGNDVKLSERLFIPSKRLRGFKRGEIGPKDGDDYVGGNYVSTLNLSTSLPIVFEDSEDIDMSIFFDAANIWGVDYNSSIDDKSGIRSSVGVSVDWWTPIGPLTFSIAQPLSEKSTDTTENFRFNIGTSF